MDSNSGMLQWYQSRRSSAAHQKIEKEIEETEIHESSLRRRVQLEKSPDDFDAKLRRLLQRLDEIIDSNKKSPQKMIDDGFSPGNPSDYSPDHVSTDPQKFDCEEALIEVPSLSANEEDSKQFVDKAKTLYNQVYFDSGNSELHKQYTVYSSNELNEKRDRGLCIWCDKFWYIGHDCCKTKKLYVFELDEELVEEEVLHCDDHLVEDCVEKDSYALRNIICADGIDNWESSEAVCKNSTIRNHELKVFEELLENDAIEVFDEIFVTSPNDVESTRLLTLDAAVGCLVAFTASKALWLDDVGCGKLMVTMFKNHSPSVIEALFSLLSRLGGLHKPWIALPELPLPPPEPPPRMI